MKKNRGGFTLVEILIVLLIVGILAGVLLIAMEKASAKARATVIVSNLRSLKSAAQMYAAEHGNSFPEIAGTGGWTFWSVTDLQSYVGKDLSDCSFGTKRLSTNASYMRKPYYIYIMDAGTDPTFASSTSKHVFVAAYVREESAAVRKALENMAPAIPLYNGDYTEYVGGTYPGPASRYLYVANPTKNTDSVHCLIIQIQ